MAAPAAMAAAAASSAPQPWRQRFWRWWFASTFQRTWLRLAVQAGVSTLLIMCIFSAPAVWDLHTYDIVLANPVLILVIANLGILFSVNTGLPAFKIALESVGGSITGGIVVYAIVYAVYGINGGYDHTATKAALTLLFGSIVLMIGTASRYRWPQHIGLAGIVYNLTVAVGLAVCYNATHALWRFVLYWWWFIGLAVVFLVVVATVVLPLPTGWVVRKQLARALRQEGKVLEAIVELMTAGGSDTAALSSNGGGTAGGGKGSASSAEGGGGHGGEGAGGQAGSGDVDALGDVRGGVLYPDFMSLEQGADAWAAAAQWPAGPQAEPSSLLGRALARLWRGGKAGSRRITSRISMTLRGSRPNLHKEAESMGIHPDMYSAVEHVYAMSGPTAASMQAAWAHMRFTHLEIDLYRPTHVFPLLAFSRMLLLARTLLSSAMMILYSFQSGRARLGASREHAGHLRRVAGEVKRCCQSLAAILRDNAPVGPALQELTRLEEAFWVLQQAVGSSHTAEAASHADRMAAAAEAAAEGLLAEDGQGQAGDEAERAAAVHAAAVAAAPMQGVSQNGSQELQQGANEAAAANGLGCGLSGAVAADHGLGGASSAQDDLALHLSLSMLFTCATRVRSMYLLLPQLVAQDQQGVGDAVARHFATAHTWDRVLHARTSLEPISPARGASDVFKRSQAVWGGPSLGSMRLRSSRSFAALEKLERPQVQVAEKIAAEGRSGWLTWLAWLASGVWHAFAAVERWTGFNRNQLALGLQMAVSFVAAMFLILIPEANEALDHRAVWAVFIIVVVHEPLLGSVIWKCVLRFGGTVVAGILGLGALYFSVLCNGLSFENQPPKFIAMTVALVVLTMPLAAGCARYGLHNAYFWVVSCLIMYTVALPGYAHESPMPILALWRLACTAIGLAIEFVVALTVFPVTARQAAHAVASGALRGMADVADIAFRSVLTKGGSQAASPDESARRRSLSATRHPLEAIAAADLPAGAEHQQQEQEQPQSPPAQQRPPAGQEVPDPEQAQQAQQQQSPQQAQRAQHQAVTCSGPGWQGNEVATGVVLRRIHKPMMEAYGRITTFRALLVPLRVEYHPFKRPARFPTGPGRRAQRLCRRMLNVLTTFAISMDAHHTESVPLLEPHAAELEGLIMQLREALQALGAMVAGTVSLESAARTVAALEQHAQHLMLRVLLSGAPDGLSSTDATQGLAFLAMLFNVTSVARLLCLSLGEAFCAGDAEGQQAAAELLRDTSRWAADDRLQALAAELVSEALVSTEDEVPLPANQ